MITLNVVAGIEYGLLERPEVEAMVGVIAEAFSRYDPLAVGCNPIALFFIQPIQYNQ